MLVGGDQDVILRVGSRVASEYKGDCSVGVLFQI